MKKTPIKKIGKIGKRNLEANKKLKKMFEDLDVRWCEVSLENCLFSFYLQFAHRHKRIDYRQYPEYLYHHNQVVLACQSCHSKIENNRELTEKVFQRLRGDDLLPSKSPV